MARIVFGGILSSFTKAACSHQTQYELYISIRLEGFRGTAARPLLPQSIARISPRRDAARIIAISGVIKYYNIPINKRKMFRFLDDILFDVVGQTWHVLFPGRGHNITVIAINDW